MTTRPSTAPLVSRFRHRSPSGVVLGATAVLIALVWIVPTVGLLVTSLRTKEAASRSGWWTILNDFAPTLSNYVQVLQGSTTQVGFAQATINSLAIAVPSTVIPLTVAVFAAYGFSWVEFKGRDKLFLLVVALMIMPVHMALVPLLSGFSRGVSIGEVTLLPALNSPLAAVWLVHTAYGLPLAVYILRNFVASLPKELVDAARIDGANEFQVFVRIVFPLTVPAIAAFGIFQFLWVFNDYLIPVIFLGLDPATAPLTVRLADMSGTLGEDQHLLAAGAFVSMAIPLVVFFSLQRYFIQGLTAGAVKA
jgi:alpha-glucoside transport system permease protein